MKNYKISFFLSIVLRPLHGSPFMLIPRMDNLPLCAIPFYVCCCSSKNASNVCCFSKNRLCVNDGASCGRCCVFSRKRRAQIAQVSEHGNTHLLHIAFLLLRKNLLRGQSVMRQILVQRLDYPAAPTHKDRRSKRW